MSVVTLLMKVSWSRHGVLRFDATLLNVLHWHMHTQYNKGHSLIRS